MTRLALVASVSVLILAPICQVRAGYITYLDQAAFDAATYNRQLIDFEGLAGPSGFTGYLDSSGLTQQGVNFVGSYPEGNWLFVQEPAVTPQFYDWGSGAVLLGPSPEFGPGSQIDVTLPAGTTAFGVDLMTILPYAADFIVALSTGENFLVPTEDFPTRTFFGITADVPINAVSVATDEGAFPLLDNFTYGQAVPLPPSAILFAIGGVSLAGQFWRKGRRCRP